MIQANGFLLRLPVAKHLPYGAKHLVMRQAKMRHRGLTIGGIKRGFYMPPSIFRFTRFVFRFISLHRAQGDHLADSSSTRQSWVLVFGSQAMPTTRGRTAPPSPSKPSPKSAA